MAFFRLCLSRLGDVYERARVVAVFGDHVVAEIPEHWRPYFKDIEIHWAHEPGAANPDHIAQHDMRFDLLDSDADICMLCDADIAVLRPMEELLGQLQTTPALAGVIAHYHFSWGDRVHIPDVDWPDIAAATIGKEISRPYRYSLMPGKKKPAFAPFYINYGVLAGPPAMLLEFHRRDMDIRPVVAGFVGNWWASQVSLPLTCADLGLATMALPMRYNFPNDPKADRLYPDELNEIVFLHYLRGEHFKREEIFAREDAFLDFLNLELDGSNDVFQRFVRELTHGVYPFPR